jgi:hypothetical protein
MVSPMFMVGSISGCVHSNQIGIFWQVEISALEKTKPMLGLKTGGGVCLHDVQGKIALFLPNIG